jgi:hypothetical protein
MLSVEKIQRRFTLMNRLLEENPSPTFWLDNSIDPAFIRRIDWVLELPMLPKAPRSVYPSKLRHSVDRHGNKTAGILRGVDTRRGHPCCTSDSR